MSKLLELLAVLSEVTGTEWSKPTVQVIERELQAYPEAEVLKAISRCIAECSKRVTLADILDRIPSQHPGVEQAWALVSKVMNNEEISICWTEEMREAYGVAAPLANDAVAARMAFKEAYQRLVGEARAQRRLPAWSVSLGFNKALREECLREAEKKNLLTHAYAARTTQLLAADPPTSEATKLLESMKVPT